MVMRLIHSVYKMFEDGEAKTRKGEWCLLMTVQEDL